MKKIITSKLSHFWRPRSKKIDKKTAVIIGLCLVGVLFVWTLRLNNIRVHGYDYEEFAPTRAQAYFSSDLVAQQTILHDWQAGYTKEAVTGDDNWVIKWPLYIVTNNLAVSPTVRHFVTMLALLWTTAIGLFCVGAYLICKLLPDWRRRWFAMGAVALFLASIPDITFEFLRWPNSRNIELPIYFGLLVVLFLSERNKRWLKHYKWQKLSGIMLVAGLLFVDDPLFMYVSALPLLVLLFFRYILGIEEWRKTIKTGGVIVASIVTMYIFRALLLVLTPIKLYKHQPGALDPAAIMANIEHLLIGSLRVVGISTDIQARTQNIYVALSVALLIAAIMGILLSLKKRPSSFFLQYLSVVFFWNCIVVATLGPGVSEQTAISRYFLILPVIELVGIILLITHLRLRRQFVTIGIILILLLGVTGLLVRKAFYQPVATSRDNQKVVDSIASYGLKKGYTNYGNANVDTYLADYKTQYLPSVCLEGQNGNNELEYFNLLAEKGVKENMKANKSFYLYFGQGSNGCDAPHLTQQLGMPSETVSLQLSYNNEQAQLFIYNYDISSKLPVKEQQ